jgi:hypothetical protein
MSQVRLLCAGSVVVCVVLGTMRVAAPPIAPRVNVRWSPQVSADQRLVVEQRFRLVMPEQLDETTWSYDLHDPSPAAIRALVAHPAVADTHGIDRAAGEVAADAPQGRTRIGSSRLSAWADSRSVSWLLVASVWTAVLSGVTLALSPRSATRGTSPRTPDPTEQPG